MNLILLGPQGSGKGTQAELLVEKYGLNYMEMGKIMRNVAESEVHHYSEIVREYIEKGLLVPEEYVKLIARDYINKQGKNRGFLFDGYPRSLQQYGQLKEMLMKYGEKIDRVVYLDISEKETVHRLTSRRTCEKCGKIYNLITNPPASENECECGGKLEYREDDKPEAIIQRLLAFKKNTLPVLEEAREEGILIEIDGEKGIEDIHKEIVKKLEVGEDV
jgi:adenylate kinase